MKPGEFLEQRYCYPPTNPEPLTAQERSEIIDYTAHFEECSYSRAELEAMPDDDLIAAGYSAMADYARGQM